MGSGIPNPPSRAKRVAKRDPNSKRQIARAKKTEGNLKTSAKMFRDRFVNEYLKDFIAVRAYLRAEGTAKGKKAYSAASELLNEPYVSQQIQIAIDSAEEANLINRNRVITGLVRESNHHGGDSSHGARVSSLSKLATILGMDSRAVEGNLASRGGVLIVPEISKSVDDWEKRAAAAQAALKEAVRK